MNAIPSGPRASKNLKLGKLPPTADSRDLQFSRYLMKGPVGKVVLPEHPKLFGHEALVPKMGMLGNDKYGDCFWAGCARKATLWNAEAGRVVKFDEKCVLGDYAAQTGFKPDDKWSDIGTNVRDGLTYVRRVGVADVTGKRHKIGAFMAIEPGHWEHLLQALFLFGAVGVGFEMTERAMQQFQHGHPWAISKPAGKSLGGHYVPFLAHRQRLEVTSVSWDEEQPMTKRFIETYCDEMWAILSEEMMLDTGLSIDGFKLEDLRADLAAVAA